MSDHEAPPVRAFIFDMDDTLAKTGPIWRAAEEHLLRSIGSSWSAELAGRYKGMNALDVAAVIHRSLQPTQTLDACQTLLRERLIAGFEPGAIKQVDGACALVRRCATHGLPMVVASGSPPEAIAVTLDALRIAEHFEAQMSSEHVDRGKPHPDIFLAAADRLGVMPEYCLVFEDSLIGLQAARAAGMRCVVRPQSPSPVFETLATKVVSSWDEADLEVLL